MIALCVEHHPHADGGAYTIDQLRKLKIDAAARDQDVGSTFNWRRNELLAIAGGICFYKFQNVVAYRNDPIVWFNRDKLTNNLLLNVRIPTTSAEPRLWIKDHEFMLLGNPVDLLCPPHGKLLSVRYSNGDAIRVEFYELHCVEDLNGHFPNHNPSLVHWNLPYPITGCEIHLVIGGGADIRMGAQEIRIRGKSAIKGPMLNVGNWSGTAINIDL